MTRPACLVTGILSEYRREPFRLLSAAEDVEVIAWRDTGSPVEGLIVHDGGQLGAARRVASGRYRAVICGLGGRAALPSVYLAARLRRIPFILWATIWSHPRTAAHALSFPATRHLYRHADAVVTYGPHVTEYVKRYRSNGNVFEAPQSVDVERFAQRVPEATRSAVRDSLSMSPEELLVLFVGRLVPEKGIDFLLEAWRLAAVSNGVLALVGEGPGRPAADISTRCVGAIPNADLPAWYAAADVVVLPSVPTRTFLEPWGLVLNEAMLQGTPVIASDAVGAAAGGLVRSGRNGLVVEAGDADSLARAIRTLAGDSTLRERLGAAAREDAARFTPAAWVEGVRQALEAVGGKR